MKCLAFLSPYAILIGRPAAKPAHMYVHLFAADCASPYLQVGHSVDLSLCLFVCLSVHLSACFSTCIPEPDSLPCMPIPETVCSVSNQKKFTVPATLQKHIHPGPISPLPLWYIFLAQSITVEFHCTWFKLQFKNRTKSKQILNVSSQAPSKLHVARWWEVSAYIYMYIEREKQ